MNTSKLWKVLTPYHSMQNSNTQEHKQEEGIQRRSSSMLMIRLLKYSIQKVVKVVDTMKNHCNLQTTQEQKQESKKGEIRAAAASAQ